MQSDQRLRKGLHLYVFICKKNGDHKQSVKSLCGSDYFPGSFITKNDLLFNYFISIF